MPPGEEPGSDDWVHVDWGEEFQASFRAAFPEVGPGLVTIDYGPMALDYLLAQGGIGYFRMGMVRSLVEQGRLRLVPDSPEFSYPSYIVHSTNADESAMATVRRGLRDAAARSL